jgi:hypothetical protein
MKQEKVRITTIISEKVFRARKTVRDKERLYRMAKWLILKSK